MQWGLKRGTAVSARLGGVELEGVLGLCSCTAWGAILGSTENYAGLH